MSVKIIHKTLPNGVIPYEDIGDPIVKRKVMLLNQNIASIAAQLAEAQKAVIELQQRHIPKQREIEDFDRYVARAEASATSSSAYAVAASDGAVRAERAVESAVESASSAERSKSAAALSEENSAKSDESANAAKESAEQFANECSDFKDESVSARNEAVAARDDARMAADAVKTQNTIAIYGVHLGANAFRRLFLSDFVSDTSRSYRVVVGFINEGTSTYNCVVWKNTASTTASLGVGVSVPARTGTGEKASPGVGRLEVELTGDDYIRIDNKAATVGVAVKFIIKE